MIRIFLAFWCFKGFEFLQTGVKFSWNKNLNSWSLSNFFGITRMMLKIIPSTFCNKNKIDFIKSKFYAASGKPSAAAALEISLGLSSSHKRWSGKTDLPISRLSFHDDGLGLVGGRAPAAGCWSRWTDFVAGASKGKAAEVRDWRLGSGKKCVSG